MHITIWGTRGSYPVCRPEVMRYGGNTTCFELHEGDDRIVVDGGTGAVALGRELVHTERQAGAQVSLFLTHPHWDHVIGLPYFGPFYDEAFTIDVYGASSENRKLEAVLATQHEQAHFPVPFRELRAAIHVHELGPTSRVKLRSLEVSSMQLNHPGMDLGYRFESPSAVAIVLTDLAPIEDNHLGAGMAAAAEGAARAFEQDYYGALVEFVRGADIVLHDTNFTEDEIANRRHWGHSTPDEALRLLSHLDMPPALVLCHHDPDHSDATMDEIYEAAKKAGRRQATEVLIAKEGGVLQL